ncbi:MAG: hypothetical protein JWQ97_2896 [Phenylobacterium sp.]|nr:hypothetical protein [Phenylobacterium sp.]
MAKAKRRLYATATALSVAAHAVLLTALWLHSPRLVRPHEDAGPPEPIIPILMLPRTPAPAAGSGQKPQPIRLHRRQLHRELPPATVAPLVAPKAEATPESTTERPTAQPRVTVQPAPATQLSDVLRHSALGCATPAILSREEREACEERLGRGAGEAPYLPPAIGRAKQAGLDAAGAAKDRNIRLKEAPMPTGVASPDSDAGASNRNKPLYTPTPPPLRP